MQSTSNYSMNLVEGTDIVNIPVQLNPNFNTIDGAMFANKQASVGTATEVVTGTAHAIVRNNPDSDVFRFTSTGAWTAGDTMSVDGSSVTVHLSDGTVPPTGAYIIGAEVLAVLNGSLVTLLIGMTPPAQGVTSFNSRTGAVVPTAGDYVAGDIDYDNTVSGLTATDVQNAIDEIENQIQNIPSGGTVDYSSTEHKIGTWTDGTDLYEKTIHLGSLPNNTAANYPTGITNGKDFIFINGTAADGAGSTLPLPYVDSATSLIQTKVIYNGTDIRVISAGNWSTFDGTITLRYTKTV